MKEKVNVSVVEHDVAMSHDARYDHHYIVFNLLTDYSYHDVHQADSIKRESV